jgi:isoprenylcysteine carboxyl methyltransferase (ICMT) family protein YpbQ
MILNYISLYVFLISFAVGLFFVYILGPETKKIYIYPSEDNIKRMLFKDKADNCFMIEEEEVECPKDASLISTVPIQA